MDQKTSIYDKQEKIYIPTQTEIENLTFFCTVILFGPSINWMRSTHVGAGLSSLLNLQDQILSCLINTHTDTVEIMFLIDIWATEVSCN